MYCEIPEFYSEQFPVARKQHKCCECHAPINVGEKYLLVGGKWDGEMRTYKQHMLCREVCMMISNRADECIPFGDLLSEYQEFTHTGYFFDPHYHRKHFMERKESLKEIRTKMAQILRRKRSKSA